MRYIFILAALCLLALPAFAEENASESDNDTVLAQENETILANETNVTINESAIGALPGDWDYGFKRFFENVDKFFTMDKSESAKKHAYYGKMRAVEAHMMSGKAQRLLAEGRDANSTLEAVDELANESNTEMEDAGDDLEAAVEDGSANESEIAQVQNETRNSIIVLQRVYEKAPEAAKDGLARALNNSINNYERHMEKMEQKEQEKEQKRNQTVSVNETDDEDENETEDGNETANGNGLKNKTKVNGKNGNETGGNETEDSDDNSHGNNGKGNGNGNSGQPGDEEEDESGDE